MGILSTVIVSVTVEQGHTEIALSRGGEVVYATSICHGLESLDRAVAEHVRGAHDVVPGEDELLSLRGTIVKAQPLASAWVQGRHLVSGETRTVPLARIEIQLLHAQWSAALVEAVDVAFERAAEELAAADEVRDIVIKCEGFALSALANELSDRFGTSVTTLGERPQEA